MAAAIVYVAAMDGNTITREDVITWGELYKLDFQDAPDVLAKGSEQGWTFSATETKPGALERFVQKVNSGGLKLCKKLTLEVRVEVQEPTTMVVAEVATGRNIDPEELCKQADNWHSLRLKHRPDLGSLVFEVDDVAKLQSEVFDEIDDEEGEETSVTFRCWEDPAKAVRPQRGPDATVPQAQTQKQMQTQMVPREESQRRWRAGSRSRPSSRPSSRSGHRQGWMPPSQGKEPWQALPPSSSHQLGQAGQKPEHRSDSAGAVCLPSRQAQCPRTSSSSSPSAMRPAEEAATAASSASSPQVRSVSSGVSEIFRIELYHDGENCPISGGPSGKNRFIDFSRLWVQTLRSIIACVEGAEKAEEKDLKRLDVQWTFFWRPPPSGNKLWQPHPTVKNDMQVCGVNLQDAGPKPDAVDLMMKGWLEKAERRWRHKPDEEKDGVVLAVLSGDSDFYTEVKQLQKTVFSEKEGRHVKGVRVVHIFSRNTAKDCYRKLMDSEMVLDQWAEWVESSQRQPEVVADDLSDVGQDQQLVHYAEVTLPQLLFLSKPAEKCTLEAELAQVNSFFSVQWPEPPARRIRIVQSKDKDDQFPSDGDRERAKETLTKYLDAIDTDPQTIKVPGFSAHELLHDKTKEWLENKHDGSVCVFIPGLKAQDKARLFFETYCSSNEYQIKKRCKELGVRVSAVTWKGNRRGEVLLDHKSKDLEAAKAKLRQQAPTAPTYIRFYAEALAILVFRQGNEDGKEELKDYLKNLGVDSQVLWVVGNERTQFAKLKLVDFHWKVIERMLKDRGLEISREKTRVQLRGKVAAVKEAREWLEERLQMVQLRDTGLSAKKANCQHWPESTKTFLRDATRPSTAHPPPVTVDSTIGEDAGGGAGRLGWSVDSSSGKVCLAFFPEDEEVFKEVREELTTFCEHYREEHWPMPDKAPEPLRQFNFTQQLRRDFQLDKVQWDHYQLLLCGHSEKVKEAKEHLTKLCSPEPEETAEEAAPGAITWLLRNKAHWAKLKELRGNLKKSAPHAVDISYKEKQGHALLKGPSAALPEARVLAREVLLKFNATLETCAVPLSDGQFRYLKDDAEGVGLINSCLRPVYYEWPPDSSQDASAPANGQPAKYRVPNGAVIEVYEGNAVAGGLGVEALVNSANEHLLRGEVQGISGAIKAAGGEGLKQECKHILDGSDTQQLTVGQVVATGAHDLRDAGFSHILHAVPPRYRPGVGVGQQMVNTIQEILAKAAESNINSIVLPLLGGGNFGWSNSEEVLAEDVAHHLKAIADWARSSATLPKRVVFMDMNKKVVAALVQHLQDFDETTQNMPGAVPPRPSFLAPTRPEHLWQWDNYPNGGWVDYDYDQCLELDCAFKAGQGKVMINGDLCGQPSDSIHIEQGQAFARYDVDFTMTGDGHHAMQINRASKTKRKVRKLPLQDQQEAMEKLPMYQQKHDMEGRIWLQAVQKWDATYGHDSVGSPAVHIPQPLAQVFRPIASPKQELSMGVGGTQRTLTLIGFSPQAQQASDKLLAELAQATKHSQPQHLPCQRNETPQQAQSRLRDFLSKRGLEHVTVEPRADGCVVLCTLGPLNLARAEKEFANWKFELSEQEAKKNRPQYPSSGWFRWSEVDENDPAARLVPVTEDSEEWREVEKLMRNQTGLGTLTDVWTNRITKVERVENPALWNKYWYTRRRLEDEAWNSGTVRELWAKHGTSTTDPQQVCKGLNGVDKNFSKTGMFGRASYVAEDARYVAKNKYCYNCPGGETGQMLLCKVAAGNIKEMTYDITTSSSLVTAPDGYDSIRADVIPGQHFYALMLYRDFQVYPAYLVTFVK